VVENAARQLLFNIQITQTDAPWFLTTRRNNSKSQTQSVSPKLNRKQVHFDDEKNEKIYFSVSSTDLTSSSSSDSVSLDSTSSDSDCSNTVNNVLIQKLSLLDSLSISSPETPIYTRDFFQPDPFTRDTFLTGPSIRNDIQQLRPSRKFYFTLFKSKFSKD
jgi:hypothetical protein